MSELMQRREEAPERSLRDIVRTLVDVANDNREISRLIRGFTFGSATDGRLSTEAVEEKPSCMADEINLALRAAIETNEILKGIAGRLGAKE